MTENQGDLNILGVPFFISNYIHFDRD